MSQIQIYPAGVGGAGPSTSGRPKSGRSRPTSAGINSIFASERMENYAPPSTAGGSIDPAQQELKDNIEAVKRKVSPASQKLSTAAVLFKNSTCLYCLPYVARAFWLKGARCSVRQSISQTGFPSAPVRSFQKFSRTALHVYISRWFALPQERLLCRSPLYQTGALAIGELVGWLIAWLFMLTRQRTLVHNF